MEKLIESIWNAAVLYCNKINEVALHPNDNPEDGPTQITKYNNKILELKDERTEAEIAYFWLFFGKHPF